MISKEQLLSLLKILNDDSHRIIESWRGFEQILLVAQSQGQSGNTVSDWAILLNLLHSLLLSTTQECAALTLALVQCASLQATAATQLRLDIPANEKQALHALRSRQVYQANTILRYLMYRLLVVAENSYFGVGPPSTTALFLVHLLKAFLASDVNAGMLIKELLAMPTVDIVTKLSVGRTIDPAAVHSLLCAYQTRYPHIMPVPPPPGTFNGVSVTSSSNTNTKKNTNSSSSSKSGQKLVAGVWRHMPDRVFESRGGSVSADDEIDRLLVVLNRFGDYYFQYGMVGTWMWTDDLSKTEKTNCLLRVYEAYRATVTGRSNSNIKNDNKESKGGNQNQKEVTAVTSSSAPTPTPMPVSDSIQWVLNEFENAHRSPLSPATTQRLTDGLRANFASIHPLTKQYLAYFSGLVEHNPVVAAEWIVLLATLSDDAHHRDSSHRTDENVGEGPIGQHLCLLLMMETNLKSVEVVSKICSHSEIVLPAVFLQTYITSCISGCSNIADVYLQTRRVRLICAFLLSLLRHPAAVETIQSSIVEIQTFCVEFARVKEASTLYRMLKSSTTERS